MTARADVQGLTPGALVSLFDIDTTIIGGNDVLRLTPHGPNELGNDVIYASNEYVRFPLEAAGFERSGQGKIARPTIRVANVNGLIGALAIGAGDLLGAKVTRTRIFVKYLDAANFAGGNPQADPNQYLDREIWFVDRKSAENKLLVEWELAAAHDVSGVMLPRRQFIQNNCAWRYRSAECGYTGGPVADHNDQPTTDPAKDQCGKRIASCKLRFGGGVLPYGGFPGVGLLR